MEAAEFDPDPPTRAYVDMLKAEIAQLRAGIKRLSDEEELQAETTGGDAFDLVAMAAKLAKSEAARTDLEAKNERLRKTLAGLDWYWPEEDTSSDACADGPWQLAENYGTPPGEIFGYSRGGVVETRYYGFLEAAEDADSDDQFEVDEPTLDAAEAKMGAEIVRRAALSSATEGQP